MALCCAVLARHPGFFISGFAGSIPVSATDSIQMPL